VSNLPPIPNEAFDGEKYSTEIKTEKCKHEVEMLNNTYLRCKLCGAGWQGPQIGRLYEEFNNNKS